MAADCAHFSMEEPDFSQLQAVADDIENTQVCKLSTIILGQFAMLANTSAAPYEDEPNSHLFQPEVGIA